MGDESIVKTPNDRPEEDPTSAMATNFESQVPKREAQDPYRPLGLDAMAEGWRQDSDYKSKPERDTWKAFDRAKAPEPQRNDRVAAAKNLQGEVGGNQPTADLLTPDCIQVGDADGCIIAGMNRFETHMGDPTNPGISFDAKTGSELRTGNLPLQRDTTTDKDIYADGKARNRKEAFGPNHLVDPYPPLLSAAPVWMQGVMRGALAAIMIILKEMQEAEK